MSLGFSGNAIYFVQAGVEPLRTVGYAGLVEYGIDQLIIEDLCIIGRSEVAVAFTPYTLAMRQAMSHLFNRCFAAGGSVFFRNTRFAEIFLSQDIGCDLTP